MLVIHIPKIPPDGQDIDAVLDPGQVHLEGEQSFDLKQGTLKAHLDKGEENTVQVKGRLAARLGLECGRCLEPFTFPIDQDLDLFYLPRHREAQAEEQDADVQLSDHQMVVVFYDDDRLDLGEMVREQFFLQVPMRRLCREDCKGLCPDCGVNRNLERCDCAPLGATDPRLAPLGKLFDNKNN
jgi:DUF177 domain-containing protein